MQKYIYIREFFYGLAELDLSDLRSEIELIFPGRKEKVSAQVVKDCLDHLIASAASGGKNIDDLTRFDIQTILLKKLSLAKSHNIITPGELKQLAQIRADLASSASYSDDYHRNGGYSLDDIHRAVQHFSPGTAREEVVKFLSA